MNTTNAMDMPVAVSDHEGAGERAPFFKLRALGDFFEGALGSDPWAAESKLRVIETKWDGTRSQPVKDENGNYKFLLNRSGKPAKKEILHLACVAGSTASFGPKGETQTVEALGHYRTDVKGWMWSPIIDGRNDLPAVFNSDGEEVVGEGQASCRDIYRFTLTHKSATVESDQEKAAMKAAGLEVVRQGDYDVVNLRSKDDELRYMGARMECDLEVRPPRREIKVEIRRADGSNPADVGAVQAAFQMWQDKVWLTNPADNDSPEHDADDVDDDTVTAPANAAAAAPVQSGSPAFAGAPSGGGDFIYGDEEPF